MQESTFMCQLMWPEILTEGFNLKLGALLVKVGVQTGAERAQAIYGVLRA